MRRSDGMEIARKVQIDFFHWKYLCISSSSGSSLHPETRAERRLAQGTKSLLPNAVQSQGKPDGYGSLTDTGFGRSNSGHQYQVALLHLFFVYQRFRNLSHITSVMMHLVYRNPVILGYLLNFHQLRTASYFYI